MQDKEFVDGLLGFVKKSPTPFHAVQTMIAMLEDAGFQRLMEKEAWHVDVGVPTFAMHSIRELAGCKDVVYLYQTLLQYFRLSHSGQSYIIR